MGSATSKGFRVTAHSFLGLPSTLQDCFISVYLFGGRGDVHSVRYIWSHWGSEDPLWKLILSNMCVSKIEFKSLGPLPTESPHQTIVCASYSVLPCQPHSQHPTPPPPCPSVDFVNGSVSRRNSNIGHPWVGARRIRKDFGVAHSVEGISLSQVTLPNMPASVSPKR